MVVRKEERANKWIFQGSKDSRTQVVWRGTWEYSGGGLNETSALLSFTLRSSSFTFPLGKQITKAKG